MPRLKRLMRVRLSRRRSLAFFLFWAACGTLGGVFLVVVVAAAHRGVFSGRCTDEQSHRILARLMLGADYGHSTGKKKASVHTLRKPEMPGHRQRASIRRH